MSLGKRQLSTIKKKVQSELVRITSALKDEKRDFTITNDERKDEVDLASSDYEQAKMMRFRNREVFYAKKLKDALKRLEEGDETFGECEECGCEIRYERLLARPTANMCISCKDEAEREEVSSRLPVSNSVGVAINYVSQI